MYPCNHGLRGTNTKNQYDIDDLIDDFDLIKQMGGFTNDAMASGSLDKAVANPLLDIVKIANPVKISLRFVS
jgi:hypothetical protein